MCHVINDEPNMRNLFNIQRKISCLSVRNILYIEDWRISVAWNFRQKLSV